MKRAITLLLALVLVPLSMGCGSVDDTSGNPTASGGKNKGGIDSLETGLVVAKTPVGLNGTPFVGDFWFGTDLICSGVSSCELMVTGDTTISFKCPKHLFVPRTAYGNPAKTIEVTWTADSDWGLAPKGTYGDQDGATYQVETKVDGKNIVLYAHGLWDDGLIVQGNDLVYNNKPSGNVSADLKVVTLIGLEDTFTLTLVE
jgi:hypothetical protein